MLTIWDVYKKGVRLEWNRPETFRIDAGTNAYAVGRRTDEIVYVSLLDQGSDIWNRSAPRGEYESLEAETTHRHPDV